MNSTTIPLRPVHPISDEELLELSRLNPALRLERTSEGALLVARPTGGQTGSRNSELTRQLANWNRAEQRGKTFDSSTGFSLSNGACYSPDAAWVRLVRWNALTADQREQYPPLSPDLAIELISASDDFRVLPGKLRDYIACGSRVALSLDPYRRLVTIVTVDREPLELSDPAFVDLAPFGEDFSGLTLDVRAIFEASPPQHSSD